MKHDTIEVSACCKAGLVEDFKDNPKDHHDPIEIYTCEKCKKECEVEEVCELCHGTGEVTVDEQVYANEPHMAPIGTQKCICQLSDPDDEYDDQEK